MQGDEVNTTECLCLARKKRVTAMLAVLKVNREEGVTMYKAALATVFAGTIVVGCGGGEPPANFPSWFPLPEEADVEFVETVMPGGSFEEFQFAARSSMGHRVLLNEVRSALDESNAVEYLYERNSGSDCHIFLAGGSDSTVQLIVSVGEPRLRVKFSHVPGWRDDLEAIIAAQNDPCR